MASNEWQGIVVAVAPKYLKGAANQLIRKRLILKMLEGRGKITFNAGSHEQRYDVEYKEPPVEAYGDGGVINYAPRDLLKQASMDWRGYIATDMMTMKQKDMAKGDTVIVDRYKRIFPTLTKKLRNLLGLEYYIDGLATGNENRFCGLETFAGEGTCAVGDIVAQPSDTYNGISTALAQSGNWSSDLVAGSGQPNSTIATDWPEGEGDPDYDYWAPKLVNWSSNAWGTSVVTWEDNCERVLRRTMQWLRHTTGVDGSTLMGMLNGALFSGFKNHFAATTRVLEPHKEAHDLGFPETLNFEGLGVASEYGVPVDTGFVLNVDEMEMLILGKELITPKGPDWDPNSGSWKFLIRTFGNFKFNPRYFAKVKNYAAA